MVLNMPYGGLPVDDYLDDFSFEKLHEVHVSLDAIRIEVTSNFPYDSNYNSF